MDLIQALNHNSANEAQLSRFLATNRQKVYDYFLTQPYSELEQVKSDIEEYILKHLTVLSRLDTANRDLRVFLTLLLDVSIRFSIYMPVQWLYSKLNNSDNVEIFNRHMAAVLFFKEIRSDGGHFRCLDKIIRLLVDAYEKDTEERIVETLIICIHQVIDSFNEQNSTGVLEFKQRLYYLLQLKKAFFIRNTTLQNVLNYDLSKGDFDSFVHKQLDNLLGRHFSYSLFSREYIVEKDSQYSYALQTVKADFRDIRQIAVGQCSDISDNSIFYSLKRGVAVLDEEVQLFMYLKSYGDMHFAKVTDAVAVLALNEWLQPISVFDWGCGQALASMVFFDYVKQQNNPLDINRVTLIEPSELALKRAALHVKKYNLTDECITVQKDLDSVVQSDLINRHDDFKVHLLSNIIDVDYFSLEKLIDLIKQSFTGVNYFVCVSPYISELKLARIDSFVDAFKNDNTFICLLNESAKKGEWSNMNWTKIIRVFAVNL